MRVLIITSSTGGGHDMRARSFKLWAESETNWEVQIHQALESTHGVYAFGVGLYNWIQRYQPRLHRLYFKYLELASMHREAKGIFGANRFRKLLSDFQPERVVSTHAHLNHGYFEIIREVLGEKVRCITLCTEFNGGYGFSKHWVNPEADLFIGGVDETVQGAIELGMPKEKVFRGGFLLRKGFYQEPLSNEQRSHFLQSELGLDPNVFTLLLATGAVGANNHLKLLDALHKRGKALQVIALCGKDEAALNTISKWSKSPHSITVKALGPREDMPKLLQSVSAIVTRPGAGTLSECIMSQTPIIFNGIGGIMPQESLNVRFAESHGLSRLMRKPAELGTILDDWEQSPQQLESIIRNLREQWPDKHPRDILERVNEA